MGVIYKDGVLYGNKTQIVELTKAQYDALTPAQKSDLTKMYFITDYDPSGEGLIDDTTTDLNKVWSSKKVSDELDDISPEWGNITGTLSSQTDLQTALDAKISSTEKGANNGVATLNASGKVPESQLPSYVDDVIEGYYNTTDHKFYEESTYTTEIVGEQGKIYISLDMNKSYRWSGSAFIEITSGGTWGSIVGTLSDQTDLQTILNEKASTVELTQTQYDALPSVDKNDPSKIYFIYKENIQEGWTGLTSFYGSYIWTDGTNIYYSSYSDQYKLNGTTWEAMTWSGLTSFYGSNIWTDGTNTYYSNEIEQYKLNGTTWEAITWTGLTNFNGSEIWTDGTNIYYSSGKAQRKLNGTIWEAMTWSGLTSFNGLNIWTDGTNIYYSSGTIQYKLNGTTWEAITWSGLTDFNGRYTWTDRTNTYYSKGADQYKLNGTTWEAITWSGLTNFYGSEIWTDGTNIYYSSVTDQYKLNGTTWETPPTFIEMEGDTIYYKDKKYSGSGSSSFPTELNNYTNPTFTKGTVITVPTTQDSDIIKADSFAVPVCDKDLACSEYNTYDGYGTITLAEDYSGTDLQIGFLVIPSIS